MKDSLRALLFAALGIGAIGLLFFAQSHPSYFSDMSLLGGVLLIQIIAVSTWHFERAFFPALLIAFLWAGMDVPLTEVFTSARWLVLGVGATVGYIKWMKGQRQHFGAFHLAAFFCVLAAMVSALASIYPQTALAKVLSLFLLFLFGASGARLVIRGREESFFKGMLLACEIAVYVSAIAYLVFNLEIWGNPNSLGAVMGVVAGPMLLWGALVGDSRFLRYRRALAVLMCVFLICYALSRAAMAALAVSAILLCVSLRKHRLLMQGAGVVIFFLAVGAVVEPGHFDQFTNSLTSSILYKDKREQGFLGSRKSPWQETISVIEEHPWFGSGFGTASGDRTYWNIGRFSSSSSTDREHGSSYLALTSWVGLLGLCPFVFLLFLLLQSIARVCRWMRRAAHPFHYSIPLAMILVGGLVHAIFEDWLFAVGYYLTVFFWSAAFMLMDLTPPPARETVRVDLWHARVAPAPAPIVSQ